MRRSSRATADSTSRATAVSPARAPDLCRSPAAASSAGRPQRRATYPCRRSSVSSDSLGSVVRTPGTGATKVSQIVNSVRGTRAAPAMPRASTRTKSSVWCSVSARPWSGWSSACRVTDSSAAAICSRRRRRDRGAVRRSRESRTWTRRGDRLRRRSRGGPQRDRRRAWRGRLSGRTAWRRWDLLSVRADVTSFRGYRHIHDRSDPWRPRCPARDSAQPSCGRSLEITIDSSTADGPPAG